MKYFGIRELIPCVDGHCKDGRCGYDESTIVKVHWLSFFIRTKLFKVFYSQML